MHKYLPVLISLGFVVLLVAPVLAQEHSVSLGHVDGAVGSDKIMFGEQITFHLRLTNNLDEYYNGWSNGFRIWSSDGAEWEQTTGHMIEVTDDDQRFLSYFGEPFGQGADSVGFTGLTFKCGRGIPPYLDTVAFQIEIGPIDHQSIGKMICLDSSWFPPGGSRWKWVGCGFAGPLEVYPTWDGPHCFTISDNCCMGERTGNVDYDPGDIIDLADLTALIDYLFISFTEPPCIAEANLDGDPEGTVDIGDLTALIDYLFISFTLPVGCP